MLPMRQKAFPTTWWPGFSWFRKTSKLGEIRRQMVLKDLPKLKVVKLWTPEWNKTFCFREQHVFVGTALLSWSHGPKERPQRSRGSPQHAAGLRFDLKMNCAPKLGGFLIWERKTSTFMAVQRKTCKCQTKSVAWWFWGTTRRCNDESVLLLNYSWIYCNHGCMEGFGALSISHSGRITEIGTYLNTGNAGVWIITSNISRIVWGCHLATKNDKTLYRTGQTWPIDWISLDQPRRKFERFIRYCHQL